MTDKQKQAIKILNIIHNSNDCLLSEDNYFLLLDFIVEQPTQVWSPTWTPPQPLEPFYKVTCTDNAIKVENSKYNPNDCLKGVTTTSAIDDKFRNVFKDIPVHKVLHPEDADEIHNQITQQEFECRLNALLKRFETLPKEELADTLNFYLRITKDKDNE